MQSFTQATRTEHATLDVASVPSGHVHIRHCSGRPAPQRVPHPVIDGARTTRLPVMPAGPLVDTDSAVGLVRPRLGPVAEHAGRQYREALHADRAAKWSA